MAIHPPTATSAAGNVATPAAFMPFFTPVALPDRHPLTPRVSHSVCVLFASPEGALDITDILTALARGAYGVLVFADPDATALRRRLNVLRELLHFVGCSRERVMLSNVSPEDGVQYAQVLADFTEKVQAWGPWFDDDTLAGSSWEAWPGEGFQAQTHAPMEVSVRLRKLAAELLETGQVEAVLGWGQGRVEIGPLLACTPAQAARLCAGGGKYPNLAVALEAAAGAGDPPRRIAIVARPQELHSIRALQRDARLTGEGLYIIGQGVPAEACDIVLAPISAGNGDAGLDELEALEQWPLAGRALFWQSQFANCVQCHGCRSACPFGGDTETIETAVLPGLSRAQALNARQRVCSQVAAALRLAERCALCASCSSACPQGVPLYLLHQKAARTLCRMEQ